MSDLQNLRARIEKLIQSGATKSTVAKEAYEYYLYEGAKESQNVKTDLRRLFAMEEGSEFEIDDQEIIRMILNWSSSQ